MNIFVEQHGAGYYVLGTLFQRGRVAINEDMEMQDTGAGEELDAGFQGVYAKLKAGGKSRLPRKDQRMWCLFAAKITSRLLIVHI